MSLLTERAFPLVAAAFTLLSALLAMAARPGEPRVAGGVALGVAVAGGFTTAAVLLFGRIRRQGSGPESATRMLKVFVGLMVARMIGYLALIMGTILFSSGDAASVGVGLVGGTLVFQGLEILFLRKMT